MFGSLIFTKVIRAFMEIGCLRNREQIEHEAFEKDVRIERGLRARPCVQVVFPPLTSHMIK